MSMHGANDHLFRRAHILRDAWRRAESFFDAKLKQGPELPSEAGMIAAVASRE